MIFLFGKSSETNFPGRDKLERISELEVGWGDDSSEETLQVKAVSYSLLNLVIISLICLSAINR